MSYITDITPVTRDTVTKRVATIPLISGEVNEVRFNRGYPYFEVVNMGDTPVYLSGDKECIAEADGVYTVPAGGGKVARLDSNTIYLSGSGTVQVTAKYEADPSFKSSSKGGESGGTAGKLDVLLPMQMIDATNSVTVDLSGNISDYDEIHVWVHTGDGATVTYPYSGNNYVIFPVKSEWNRDEITVQVNGPKIWLKSVKDGLADNQILIGAYSGKRYYAVYGLKFGSGSGGGGGGVDEAYVIGKMTQAVNTSKAYTNALEEKVPTIKVNEATHADEADYAVSASIANNAGYAEGAYNASMLGNKPASDYQLKADAITADDVSAAATSAEQTAIAYTDSLEERIPTIKVNNAADADYASSAGNAATANNSLSLGGFTADNWQRKIYGEIKTVSCNTQYKFFNLDVPADKEVISVTCETPRHYANFWKSDTSWCATVFNNQSPTMPVASGEFTFIVWYL